MRITILCILLTLSLNSCSGQTTYTIDKGAHYPKPKKYVSHGSISVMERTITFDSTCLYSFGTNEDSDINKAFGWGIGLVNDHSLRIGWNCRSGEGINLYAYIHYKGKRWLIPKDSVVSGNKGQIIGGVFKPNIPIVCRIERTKETITFTAIQSGRTERLIIKFYDFPDGFGWYQWPYFGGNMTAPHQMKIILE